MATTIPLPHPPSSRKCTKRKRTKRRMIIFFFSFALLLIYDFKTHKHGIVLLDGAKAVERCRIGESLLYLYHYGNNAKILTIFFTPNTSKRFILLERVISCASDQINSYCHAVRQVLESQSTVCKFLNKIILP